MPNTVSIHLKDTREGTVIDRIVFRDGFSRTTEIVVDSYTTLSAAEVLALATLNKQLFIAEVTAEPSSAT